MTNKVYTVKQKFPPLNERIPRYVIKKNEIREMWFDSVYEINGKFVWENSEEVSPEDYWTTGKLSKL